MIAQKIPSRRENVLFKADQETLAGTFTATDIIPHKSRILFLHGAGKAARERIFYLADHLASQSHPSFCFDFSGHGESTGSMQASSLERRVRQAEAALIFSGSPAPEIIIGTSMGGYVAACLSTVPSIHTLILICPALYAKEAHNLHFDDSFTNILRQPDSFHSSDIPAKLSQFTGKVLLLIGADDQIIPQAVMDIYRTSFVNAAVCHSVVIPEAPHAIHAWAQQKPEQAKLILDAIDSFLAEESKSLP